LVHSSLIIKQFVLIGQIFRRWFTVEKTNAYLHFQSVKVQKKVRFHEI